MAFDISFAGATEYTPYEGGSDVYPFDGLTFGDIVKIEEGDSKTGNKMLIFTLACAEEEAKGLKVKKWVPVTGTRSDGKPNVLGLLEDPDGGEDRHARARATVTRAAHFVTVAWIRPICFRCTRSCAA